MRAGLGKSNITPPMGVELAGYGYYLKRQAQYVNDPLFARALILEDNDKRLALISCDLLGLSQKVCDTVRDYAVNKHLCNADKVIIVSTHTHTGPCIKYHEGCGETDESFLSVVANLICLSLDEAENNLDTVTNVGYASDILQGDYIYNRANPLGPVDKKLRGFKIKRENNNPIAVLNSACHGVFNGRVPFVSADYPGVVNTMANEMGYDSIYVNGLCGDIDPYNATPEKTKAYAKEITDVLNINDKSLPLYFDGGQIDFTLLHDSVSKDEIISAADEAVKRAGGESEPAAIVALRWKSEMLNKLDTLKEEEPLRAWYMVLGDMPIMALPFEGFTNIGNDIREVIGNNEAVILGCAEELKGYLPTKDDFKRGAYAALESTFLYKRLPVRLGEAERLGEVFGKHMANVMKNLQ